MTVTLLLARNGCVISVWESEQDAEKQRDKYNDDPFVGPGIPDDDAPYRTETRVVRRPED